MPKITFEESPKRRYLIDGREVPSVTQILGCLDKGGGLLWWAMTVGVAGAIRLARNGELGDDAEAAVKSLTSHKLTVNHVRDSAATRGTSLHDALEQWLTRRIVPRASDFPQEDRGFVQALALALVELKPDVLLTEQVVGSAEHSFAGRYDLLAKVGNRVGRIDLKSGKRVYDTHMMQLEAYELAAIECGEDPSDFRAVLHLDADGTYELVESVATADQFLAVLDAYNAVTRLKLRVREVKREQKVAA